MERGIVSAVNGRRARVKRPDGYVTGWLFLADAVLSANAGDIVFYEPFGNDGLILHAVGADFVEYAPAQHDHDSSYLKLIGGTLAGGLDVGGHDLQNYIAITSENGNDYATYPVGLSYSMLTGGNHTQTTGEDFPLEFGTILNVNYNNARFFQLLVNHALGLEVYCRQYYQTQDGFQPWTRIPTTAVKKLWGTGSWTSGYIDVPGIERYHLLGFKLSGSSAVTVAFRLNLGTAPIYGGVFYPNADDRVMTKYLSISVDGNRLTRNRVFSMYHYASGDHSGVTDRAIEEVWGIL